MPSKSHHHLHSNTHNHHLSCNSTGMLQISEHNKKRKWKTTNHHHHHSSPVDNLQHHFRFLLHFIILLSTLPITTQQSYDGVIITQSDLQGLQAFKSSIIDTKGYLRSWNDSGFSACSGGWAGIKCAQGQVIVIQLPWKGFRGKITDKIGQLQALRKLSLHDNQIAGSIPPSIGLLPNLRGLQLFNNRLTGSIPLTLGLCPLLQTLDLSNNALTGSIPATLANSTKLYWLNLSSNSLSGSFPTTLTTSKTLTLLALQYNNLTGSIPTTIGQLTSLRYLDFSHNAMDGQLPDAIGRLHNLSLLNLRGNHINGTIPSSIGNISALKTLDLSHNQFNGHIPVSISNLPRLGEFNVSYNNLSGPVPVALSNKFNSSSFIGNLKLCGYSPNAPLCPSEIAPSPVVIPAVPSPDEETDNNHHHRKLSTKDIIIIVAGALLLMLLILCCILLCCLIKKRSSATTAKSKTGGAAAAAGTGGATARGVEKGGTSGSAGGVEVETSGEAGGKLVHFEGMLVFTADDLLCATAEIMGKSTYGTVYKATLEDGSQVAVKRLREKITKGQKEFESEVNVLGKIRHPNLLALRAYYLGPKGEKLLVFDYIVKGSLANFLHAREPEVQIDWGIRMKIIKGTTRGLSYLHNQANIIHGNLTSSNVLIDEDNNAKISDYGLSRLTTGGASTNVIAAAGALGYRAPELSKLKKANTKTDVYSLGVIILELLTGKSPGEAVAGGGGVDLPQWVASIVKEEWTNEVFDVELMKDASLIGDELLNTLKLALHCVDPTPTARPEAKQVLQQLEEIIRTEGGGGTTSSGDDGGIGPSAASD